MDFDGVIIHIIYILPLVLIILARSAWGIACNRALRKKGYSENWFWEGFFSGEKVYWAIKAMPGYYDKVTYTLDGRPVDRFGNVLVMSEEQREEDMLKKGGWKCVRCGQLNAKYVTTCNCGCSKEESLALSEFDKHTLEVINKYKDLLELGAISQEEFESIMTDINESVYSKP